MLKYELSGAAPFLDDLELVGFVPASGTDPGVAAASEVAAAAGLFSSAAGLGTSLAGGGYIALSFCCTASPTRSVKTASALAGSRTTRTVPERTSSLAKY